MKPLKEDGNLAYMAEITERDVEKLAELARIRISDPQRKRKLVEDLKNILGYFEELKNVDTEGVKPDVGGGLREDVVRKDEVTDSFVEQRLKEEFPASEGGFLKTPPVFE